MSPRCSKLPSAVAVVQGGALVIALLLPLVFNPWAAQPFEPAKVIFFRLVAVTSLAVGVVCQFAKTRGWHQGSIAGSDLLRLGSPPLIYAGVLVVATIFSLDPPRSFWGAPHNLHGALTTLIAIALSLLLALAGLTTRGRIERLLLALLVGSVPVVVYGLAQAVGLDPLEWMTDSVSPVLSTLGRSNFLGAYLAVVMPFTLARLLASREPGRGGSTGAYGVVLAMQATCLLLTLARAAVLAVLAGCVVLLGLLAWRWHRWQLAAVLGVALMAGISWLAVTQTQTPLAPVSTAAAVTPDQPAAPTFTELRTASVAARSVIWQATLRMIPDRWLLGYGPETFAPVFAAHYPVALAQYQAPEAVVEDAHNLILNHLMASGLAGLLALVGVVVSFYVITWRVWRQATNRWWQVTSAAMLGAMTAWMVQAQFNPQGIVLMVLFWFLLALAVASHRLAARSRNPQVTGLLR